jgi:hypothetical protein
MYRLEGRRQSKKLMYCCNDNNRILLSILKGSWLRYRVFYSIINYYLLLIKIIKLLIKIIKLLIKIIKLLIKIIFK